MTKHTNEELEPDEGISSVACPTVGMEAVSQITRALFGYKKPASYKDLAAAADIHRVHASKSLSTAKDVGFARTIRRGIYELTDNGEEYARLLAIGDRVEAQNVLSKTILQNPSWATILRFLATKKSLEKPVKSIELAAEVERRLNKRWSPSMREKTGSFFMTILEEAGLVDSSGYPSTISLETSMAEQQSPTLKGKHIQKTTPQSRRFASLVSEGGPSNEYAEFSIPDFFIVLVKKNQTAIDYLRKQLADGSVFASWLDVLEKNLNAKTETNDEEGD